MPLSRDDILNAIDLPSEEMVVPEWGGTNRVKGVPMANERLQAYIQAPVDRPQDPNEAGKPTRRPKNDGTTADTALSEIMEKALAVSWTKPSAEEQNMRKMVGAVILCTIGPDGEPLFSWEDAPLLREKNLNVVARVATRIFELATIAQIDLGEAGKDSEPTPS